MKKHKEIFDFLGYIVKGALLTPDNINLFKRSLRICVSAAVLSLAIGFLVSSFQGTWETFYRALKVVAIFLVFYVQVVALVSVYKLNKWLQEDAARLDRETKEVEEKYRQAIEKQKQIKRERERREAEYEALQMERQQLDLELYHLVHQHRLVKEELQEYYEERFGLN